jgi:hypothetical protein
MPWHLWFGQYFVIHWVDVRITAHNFSYSVENQADRLYSHG